MASAPFLVNIDLNNNQLENAALHNVAGTPAAGYGKGAIYIDTRSGQNKPKWYDGSAWQTIWPFSDSGDSTVGTITGTFSGNLTGNVTGNVSGSSGSCTGNAAGLSATLAVTSGGTGTTDGSITGTGALTFTAGGTDQNINLTPSGTGSVVSGGSISAPDVSTATLTATGLALLSGGITATANTAVFNNVQANTISNQASGGGITLNPETSVSLSSKKIVNLADPTAAQDAATKKYVDDTAQGLDIKQSCVAASTAALPSYVATGTAGAVGAYLEASANGTFPTEIQYISSPQVGDRVLVKNESSTLAKWNGIYTITATGGALAKWKLTRATDFDAGTATTGAFVFIEQGSTLGGTGWVMTTSGTITINSTAIVWTQFSGAGSYGANRGIVLDTTTNQFNFAQNSDYTTGTIPYASSTTAIGFKSVTGTGDVVLAAAPTLTGLTTAASINVGSNTLVANLPSYTGKVGIGTATPGYPLHLIGELAVQETSAGVGSKISLIGDATKYNFRIGKQLNASNTFEITPSTAAGNTTFSNPVYTVTNAGVHTFLDGAGSARMTLNATGLGIGVVSPTQKLDVRGSAYFERTTNPTNGVVIQTTNQTTASNNGCKLSFDVYNVGSSGLGIASDALSLAFYVGGLASANEKARIDSSGNFGLGTAPGAMFHIKGTSPVAIFENTGNNAVYLQLKRPNQLYYIALDIGNNGGRDFTIYDGTASASRLTIDSSGNLGLGVTPNAWSTGYKAIQLSGQGVSIFGSTAASYAGIGSNGFYDGTKWVYNNSAPGGLYVIDQNVHKWYNVASGSATTEIVWNTRMTLDASGNLGINTASPSTRLHIKGTAGGVGCTFRLEPATSTTIYSQIVGNNGDISIEADPANNEATSAIKFNVDGSLKALINASGRLLLGTPDGVGTDFVSIKWNSSTAYSQAINIVDSYASANSTAYLVFRKSDDTYLGNIRRDGTNTALYVGGNSYLALGTGDTTRLTISSTGAATFTGTVTVKSNSGTGTGYAPAIYNATLTGDGSTTAFTVTHNFSNPKPIVQVWQKGSPYGLVYADITSNSTGTTTTITFATAPASGTDYWVTVLG